MFDVEITRHGGLFVFHLLTERASAWVEENVQTELSWVQGSFVVEHRYALNIAQGMLDSNLLLV